MERSVRRIYVVHDADEFLAICPEVGVVIGNETRIFSNMHLGCLDGFRAESVRYQTEPLTMMVCFPMLAREPLRVLVEEIVDFVVWMAKRCLAGPGMVFPVHAIA